MNKILSPISMEDLLKAIDIESIPKKAFIIVEDFYKQFREELEWPIASQRTKWPTSIFWIPVFVIRKKDLITNLIILRHKYDIVYVINKEWIEIFNL